MHADACRYNPLHVVVCAIAFCCMPLQAVRLFLAGKRLTQDTLLADVTHIATDAKKNHGEHSARLTRLGMPVSPPQAVRAVLRLSRLLSGDKHAKGEQELVEQVNAQARPPVLEPGAGETH